MSTVIADMTLLILDAFFWTWVLSFDASLFPFVVIFSFRLLLSSFMIHEVNWVISLFLKSCIFLNTHDLEFIVTLFIFHSVIIYLKWTIFRGKWVDNKLHKEVLIHFHPHRPQLCCCVYHLSHVLMHGTCIVKLTSGQYNY